MYLVLFQEGRLQCEIWLLPAKATIGFSIPTPTQNMHSSIEVMKRCCTRLWKLNIPPKIKTFWWRALQNGLPVATNMKIRVPKIDHICQTCGEMDEIVDHVLFQCRVTKEIWSMVPSLFQSQLTEQTTFLQNVDILLDRLTKITETF